MDFSEIINVLIDSVKLPLNYLVDTEKRIHFLYLISSTFLAYYVYKNLKLKYSFAKYLFNKKVWGSNSALVDYFMIFFNSFIKLILIAPYVKYGQYLTYYTDEFLATNLGLFEVEFSKSTLMVLYAVILTLLNDLSTYLVHLLMHKWKFLWEFHKIHHSATVLNPVTQYRIHPVELIINNAKAILVYGLTAGIFDYLSIEQIQQWEFLSVNIFSFIFLFWGANLRHSHVKLKYFSKLESLFISPFQHQIHHSNNPLHYDKNMGAKLAIWDKLFGTLIKSEEVKNKIYFGLGKEEDPNYRTFLQNIIMPFKNLFKFKNKRT